MAYTIQPNDTITGIAQKYGVDVPTLLKLNPGITDPNLIIAGSNLNVPQENTNTPVQIPTTQPNTIQPQQKNQVSDIQKQIDELKSAVSSAQQQGYSPNQDINVSPHGEIAPPTFSQKIQSTLDQLGITPQVSELQPAITNFSNAYKTVYESLGLSSVKDKLSSIESDYAKVQDELNSKVTEINDNPWLSEGQRVSRINKIQSQYEGKLTDLTNRKNLFNSIFTQGTQQAQFIAEQALNQVNQSDKFNQDLALEAVKRAEDLSKSQQGREVVGSPATGYYSVNKLNPNDRIQIIPPTQGGGTQTQKDLNDYYDVVRKLEASKGNDGYVNTSLYGKLKAQYPRAFSYLQPEEWLNPQDATAKKYLQTSTQALKSSQLDLNNMTPEELQQLLVQVESTPTTK